ncbi:uncharacterized protein CDAR_12891 [Caerostris darwini]|uniref:Uncharacterized protein n=1 Tax=Caerostris darwini TaxID=1538125 RepID=A0AAV4SCI3_9ARAC|nr:uncharacterized protein CDAR_12891 [Caerostris darwini]
MPAQNETSDPAQPEKIYLLDMKEILTLDSIREEKMHISNNVDTPNHPNILNKFSNYNSCDNDMNRDTSCTFNNNGKEASLKNFASYSEHCKENSDVCSSIINLEFSDTFTDKTVQCSQPAQFRGYVKKNFSELNSHSLKELQVLIEDLSRAVEAVSSELVQLLLENDALQQETDARNIAIEQLLQLAVKNTENELRPIQMSVILPSDESDVI